MADVALPALDVEEAALAHGPARRALAAMWRAWTRR